MKEKSKNSSSNSEKVLPLTLTSQILGLKTISYKIWHSEYQTRKPKKLVAECGILTSPSAKKGRNLHPETETLVRAFYLEDKNSRLMPDMKDFVSVKQKDGYCKYVNLKGFYSALIDAPIKTHHDAIKKIVSSDPTPECYIDKFSACPGTSALKDFIKSVTRTRHSHKLVNQEEQWTEKKNHHLSLHQPSKCSTKY